MADLKGRCLCGKTTWQSEGPVLWAGHCHCESCRRATAAPFTSFFGVPRAGAQITGPVGRFQSSGGRVERQYCTECGTQITYQYAGWPDETHLYAGTLDDPGQFQPRAHYHYAERLDWVEIADDLPKYPGSADTTEPL